MPKQSMQLLSIRHQFKIAFFTEMKQDPAAALRLATCSKPSYDDVHVHILLYTCKPMN